MALTRVSLSTAAHPTGSQTSLTITFPAASPGQLLLGAWSTDKHPGAFTEPAGWNVLVSQLGISTSQLLCWKIAAGGETTATTTWTTAIGGGHGWVARYDGHDANTPFGVTHFPAYSDVARTSMSFNAGTVASNGMAVASFSVDSLPSSSDSTNFRPQATDWTWVATALGNSAAGGTAFCERTVTAGQALAPTFTWIQNDQVTGLLLTIREGAAEPVGQQLQSAATSAAGAADTASRTLEANRAVADTAGATDSASWTADMVRPVTDAAGASDTASRTLDAQRSPVSTAGAVDSVAVAIDYVRTASSSAGAVDTASIAAAGVTERAATSTAGATDSVTVQVGAGRGAVSTAGVTDTVTWEMSRVITRFATSGAEAVDTVTAVRDVHRTASSTAGAVDAAGVESGVIATATSAAGATDSHSWTISTFRGVYQVVYGRLRPAITRGRLRFSSTSEHEES